MSRIPEGLPTLSFEPKPREVAFAINYLLKNNYYPFVTLKSAPSPVRPGATYYDTTLNKVRTWDGAAWNALW